MPFFKVLVQGRNLRMGVAGSGRLITGFFATRFVLAPSIAVAESEALLSVRRLWLTPEYAARTGAVGLQLTVSESSLCSVWQWLKASNRGHSFYEIEA